MEDGALMGFAKVTNPFQCARAIECGMAARKAELLVTCIQRR